MELWSPILVACDPSNLITSSNDVSALMPVPTFGEPVLLVVPFHVDRVVHPKIPCTAVAKRKWTTVQRNSILAHRPFTVRKESEFHKQVMFLL